jgi:hypothetical protein
MAKAYSKAGKGETHANTHFACYGGGSFDICYGMGNSR